MNWLYYLLEANLYLAVFYAFYKLFLHQETFYSVNRYYLIITTFISFALPFFQVGYINSLFPATQPSIQTITLIPVTTGLTTPAITADTFALPMVLLAVYLLIATIFLLKMIISLVRIFTIFFTAKREKIAKVIYVELEGPHTAFSFFNILFINPGLSHKDTVLEHEMVHINQNHTLDVLFFEMVQMICWFNPVTYFMKEDIKLLHEYIADELTTSANIQKHDYALFIIENSFGVIPNKLSNQIFNHSLIKRRIKMLNKQKSGGRAKLRFLLLIPLTGGLLFTSTMAFSKEYVLFDLLPEQQTGNLHNALQDTFKYSLWKDVHDPAKIFFLKISFTGRGAAQKQVTFEKRLIVINGKTADTKTFMGVADFDKKTEVAPTAAVQKYGKKAQHGAVEFSGTKIKLINDKVYPAPPPPAAPPLLASAPPKEAIAPPRPPKVKPALLRNPKTPPAPPKKKYSKNDIIYGDPTPVREIEIVPAAPVKNTDGAFSVTPVKHLPEGTMTSNGKMLREVEIAPLKNEIAAGTNNSTPVAAPQTKISPPPPVSKIKVKQPKLIEVKITGKAKSTVNN